MDQFKKADKFVESQQLSLYLDRKEFEKVFKLARKIENGKRLKIYYDGTNNSKFPQELLSTDIFPLKGEGNVEIYLYCDNDDPYCHENMKMMEFLHPYVVDFIVPL